MIRTPFSLFAGMALLLGGCAPDQLSPDDYRAWVDNPKHGLRVTKELKHHNFELQYRPVDYVALKELESKSDLDLSHLQSRREKLKNLQHFILRVHCPPGQDLLKDNLSEEQDYYNRIDYYHSYMPGDLRLIDGNDTLAPALFHYERTFSVGPYHTFVLGFPTKEGSETTDKELIWNAWMLDYGPVHLRVKGSDLRELPMLYL